MSKKAHLTELEHTILGVVFLEQPCTAYTVRSVFARSLSARWTSSAGSIYPAMRRLACAGCLKSRARAGDGRQTELFSLTARGRAALEHWLSPPLPDAAALLGVDPLRTRLRFLAAVPPATAGAVVDEAREKLTTLLETVRRQKRTAQAAGDAFAALAHRAAELALQAQLRFLSEVASHLNAAPR